MAFRFDRVQTGEAVMKARLLVVIAAQTLWSAALAGVPAYDVTAQFALLSLWSD
jgi:hypothetical protein